MTDLRRAVRSQLTAMLTSPALRSPHAALLVDRTTLRVLSHGVRMSELLDEAPSVTLVELVHSPREARAPPGLAPSMDAIYFLEPTVHSLEGALADYAPASPAAYGGSVHFIFSRRLPDALLALIRNSPVLGRIATLRELNLQFLPLRRTAFSLDAPHALDTLYGPSSANEREEALSVLAEQLATVYASSQLPLPRVRYAASHPVCKTFAHLLSAEFEALAAAAPAAPPTQADDAAAEAPGTAPGTVHAAEPATMGAVASDSCPGRSAVSSAASSAVSSATGPVGGAKRSGRRGTLLLLERSLDPITPLLIDFSLEALGEGLGFLRNGRVVPSSRYGGGAVPSAAPPSLERSSSAAALGAARPAPGTAPGREVLLLDSDPIWADLRHRPFEETGEEVRQHLLRFQAEHALVTRQQQEDKTMSDAMRQEAARMQLGLSYRRRHEQIQTQQELIRALQVRREG